MRAPGFIASSLRGADDPDGLRGLRKVDRDEVRSGDDLVHRIEQLDAHLRRSPRRHVRVVSDKPHPEGRRPLRHERPDAAEPDDPEGLAVKLDALPLLTFPAAAYEGRMSLRDVAGLSEEQGDRVLGGREDVRLRGVDDEDAVPRGRLDVDVVEADAGPPHHLQVLGPLEEVCIDLRCRANDQGVVVRR